MQLYDTLTDLLAAARNRDRQIRFIDGENDESTMTFSELWNRASALLGSLQSRGMQQGDELVIFSKSNERFVVAYWAAILGGIVPVPVAVGISDEHRQKLFRILSQLRRATLFTESDLLERLLEFSKQQQLGDITATLGTRTALMRDVEPGDNGELFAASPDDMAFIQYSSGSTSDPKGVCLTHRNLCTNIRAIVEGVQWTDADQSLSWMPLTHDMGLIGYHLSVLAAGMNHAVMDTNAFVRRPLLWMIKAAELRATQLCSPNFGYKHFLKLFERKGLPDLDLSRVKLILNGAEPISYSLCEEFLAALAPYGLQRNTMFPVYGLAEATVGVTMPQVGDEYSRIIVHRHSLRVGDAFEPAELGDLDAVSFVKVGSAIRDVDIRIVDDADELLLDGKVGNIQLRGGSITERVYDDVGATEELFSADGWLRTGDCGVFVDEQLVITGRSKDIIIVNGQNYYPHDIEEIAAEVEGLDLGKVVVGGTRTRDSQTEELLVFAFFKRDMDTFRLLSDKVRIRIGEQTGLEVDHVIPVRKIPKTTSGKVQRAALLNSYLDGEFDAVIEKMAPKAVGEPTDDDPLVAELELICREFSKERTIGPEDDLFEIGVSSLTLTEIALAIDERYPGKLDISDIFDYPTLREIAAFLRR
ncbi:MAG: non-ribosomal peptide synthetase [Gammaproteobacteria bacterium]|nr:non-ribosomal peptide synthetase [Gammaproteobacteria bacterium]MDH3805693.1 non-ribosomal peptide synthetase [Gammaproteobacteria bacterium]